MSKTKYRYYWKGLNTLGEKVQGVIDASSVAFVKVELHKQGIRSQKITQKHMLLFNRKKITQTEIAIFCRQTATLLKAGISLLQAFDIVAKSQNRLSSKWLVEDIKKHVMNGFSLSEALHHYPTLFNELSRHLISVGEKTGNLDVMLESLANYKEKLEVIKRKLKKALIYPTSVLFVACSVSFLLLNFVVPQFESLFKNFGATLPLLTQVVIQCSTWNRTYGLPLFFVALTLSYGLFKFKKHQPSFNQFLDQLLLKFPIFGALITKAIIARLCQTLAISFAAGLPLFNALNAAEGVTANGVYVNAIHQIKNEVYSGQSLHLAMKNTFLFPHLVVQMIAIGEESGSLESMLNKVAHYYEEEINNAVDLLNTLLEPTIMAILGLIVGTLVIAMYLPIFKLGSVM